MIELPAHIDKHSLPRLLTLAVALTLTAVSLLSWTSFRDYRFVSAQLPAISRMEELRGQILLLDEVLTMSARMSAATADPLWEARYRRFDPQLDHALKEAMNLAPAAAHSQAAAQTDVANAKLVILENRAFELVRQGQQAEAQQLLASNEYEVQKKSYSVGMKELSGLLKQTTDSARARQQVQVLWAVVAAVIAAPLLLLGWWYVLRSERQWRTALVESNAQLRRQKLELEDFAHHLDQKVSERTKQLNESQVHLHELNSSLERRVAERTAQLEEANRAKSSFLANVTHELRTPLNSVIGFAELLKDEVPGPLNAKQAAFAADIFASGQRLLALVEGILEMSRLDVSGAAREREPVEIRAALEERVAAHRGAAAARGIAIQLEVAPDAGSAELDSSALRRMLDALLDNAIKFNRDGGPVAVRARRNDGWLDIAVADSGIGIAREDLAKIFKPLTQLDAGLARRHGGVGLGLALARRLAELHGGTIEVESEPGKGSTFTLRLPTREKS